MKINRTHPSTHLNTCCELYFEPITIPYNSYKNELATNKTKNKYLKKKNFKLNCHCGKILSHTMYGEEEGGARHWRQTECKRVTLIYKTHYYKLLAKKKNQTKKFIIMNEQKRKNKYVNIVKTSNKKPATKTVRKSLKEESNIEPQ